MEVPSSLLGYRRCSTSLFTVVDGGSDDCSMMTEDFVNSRNGNRRSCATGVTCLGRLGKGSSSSDELSELDDDDEEMAGDDDESPNVTLLQISRICSSFMPLFRNFINGSLAAMDGGGALARFLYFISSGVFVTNFRRIQLPSSLCMSSDVTFLFW